MVYSVVWMKESNSVWLTEPSFHLKDETIAQASSSDLNLFSNRDYRTDYSDYVTVTLSDGGSAADGAGVSVSGSTVTITQEGTYLLTGTLSDGQIQVSVPDTDKVQLVLDNASITSQNSAALYILEADKVFLTTAAGTENLLASAGEYVAIDENNIDGAVFSKTDLTMNGEGLLTVTSQTGHGVVCKDDLKITSGSYDITAARDGLSANDSIRIAAGDISIQSGSDGMEASSDKEGEGYIYILSGTFDITCENDGIQASSDLSIVNGSFAITAGGGQVNGPEHMDFWGMPNFGGFASENAWEEAEEDYTGSDSHKGLKSDTRIAILGGSFRLDTADDALHSNGEILISDGTFHITSGDDGIHADVNVTVDGGVIEIAQSYEGIEGHEILISGGEISIVSEDDGFNACGGGFGWYGGGSGSSLPQLRFTGGTVTVNAAGDGLDSNGDLIVDGGLIVVDGPTNSSNGALDSGTESGGKLQVNGGTLIAIGASGMAETFGSTSAQNSMRVNLSSTQAAGTQITIAAEDGTVLFTHTSAKTFNSIVFSSPDLVQGETYQVTVGSETTTVTLNSVSTSTGSGGGMGGMGGPGGMGGGPGGRP